MVHRLDVLANGFELFGLVVVEDARECGVLRHLGFRDEAERIVHPFVKVAGAEAVVDHAEVDALDFEGGGLLIVDAMAAIAGVVGDEGFADLDLIGGGGLLVLAGSGEAVVLGESESHVLGVEREGGHAHVEPGARSGLDRAEEHFLGKSGVEHGSHVGEGWFGLDEAFVVRSDVGDEVLGLGVGHREETGLPVVDVAGGAVEGLNLTGGVGFDGVVLDQREDGGGEGFLFVARELEAGRLTAFFIGSKAALVGPVFEVGKLGSALS